MERTFNLKLASGKIVKWNGKDGEDAARRYVDTFPSETVIAWRYPKFELVPGMINIVQ